MTDRLTLYCDGACLKNPGVGGYGVVFLAPDHVIEMGAYDPSTTNNKMELRAVIEGLKLVLNNYLNAKNKIEIELYSDSKYVIQGITEWVHGWIKRGWLKSDGQRVLNQEIWQQLYLLTQEVKKKSTLSFKYVKGHSGDPGNERADAIASALAAKKQISLYEGPRADYHIKELGLSQ